MKFTVRYAHMFGPSTLKVGDAVKPGDIIGIMGTSGQSKHNHLHIDVVEGYHNKIIRLKEIGPDKKYKPSEKQLNYFIDNGLFRIDPVITTPYLDPEYKELLGKNHHAIDCVPEDRHKSNDHFKMYWNRTKTGSVVASGFDKGGYGNYILIGFET